MRNFFSSRGLIARAVVIWGIYLVMEAFGARNLIPYMFGTAHVGPGIVGVIKLLMAKIYFLAYVLAVFLSPIFMLVGIGLSILERCPKNGNMGSVK